MLFFPLPMRMILVIVLMEAPFVQGGQLVSQSECLSSYFTMVHRYLMFAPDLILQPMLLPNLLQASAAVVHHEEKDSCKAVLGFLGYLLFPGKGGISVQTAWPR